MAAASPYLYSVIGKEDRIYSLAYNSPGLRHLGLFLFAAAKKTHA